MNNLVWKEELSEVLNLYDGEKCVAELFTDENGDWLLNSSPLGLWEFYIEIEKTYNKKEAKAYVEGLLKEDLK